MSYMKFGSRTDTPSGGLGKPIGSLRLNFQWVCGDRHGSPNVNVKRRTLTGIFKNYLDERIGVEVDQLHVFSKNIRSQLADNSLSGILSNFSCSFADSDGPPQKPTLYADSDELQKGHGDRSDTKLYRIPVELILGRTILGLLFGLILSVVRWENLYNRRRLRGAA